MNGNKDSFVSLSRRAFNLLPITYRAKALQNTLLLVLLAGLEVLSLAVIFPLLQVLMGSPNARAESSLLKNSVLAVVTENWGVLLASIVLLYLIKNIFAVWQIHRQSGFLDRLYLHFGKRIYKHFYQMSWSQYTQINSTESFRKIKNTAYEFTHNVLHSYFIVLPEVLICMLMMVLAVWIDYRILFVLVILFLPILVFYFFFRKNVVLKIDKSFRELTPQANIVLSQGIDSFAEARIYEKENFFIEHFIDISKTTTHLLSKLKAYVNLPARIVETIGVLCFSGIIVYGKLFPDAHQHLLVFLVMLSLVIYRIIPSINRIVTNISQIQAYAYAVSELEQSLNGGRPNEELERKEINFSRELEIRSVTFRYDSKSEGPPLLKDVSTLIVKGDFVLLEGPSGSGKTTFMHLLTGLIYDYDGQILIDGSPLTNETRKSWQSRLGFVQQSPIILQDTILQNVAFGLESRNINPAAANKAIELAGLAEFVNTFSLKMDTPVGENGLTLSGGQRQRLALARALYRDPEILLLDEVTNQLDEENKLLILKNLQAIAGLGKTIMLISHDPVARSFANRVLHLSNGTIRETKRGNTKT